MAQQTGSAIGNIVLLLLSLVAIAFVLVPLVASWRIFAKAGQPGWAAFIPIYNLVVLLKIVGRPLWWLLLLFVPVANMIIPFILMHDLSQAFGKDIGFTLGLIFLSPIFILILAFGPAQYVGARTDDAAPGQSYTGAGEPIPAEMYDESATPPRQGFPVKIAVAALAILLVCGGLGIAVSMLTGTTLDSGDYAIDSDVITTGGVVYGSLANSLETQDWTFEGSAGQTVTIRCNPVASEGVEPVAIMSGLDPVIMLIGPDGETLAEDDDSGGGYSALMTSVNLPDNGQYTIHVRAWSGDGDYALMFE
jgi:hypothetical protein